MGEQMLAAVLQSAPGRLSTELVEIDDPQRSEVKVRTLASGLCHSDIKIKNGQIKRDLPMILGHEVVGVVETVGHDVVRVAPGDMVVGCLSAACGSCHQCLRGHRVVCASPDVARAAGDRPRITASDGPVAQSSGIGGFAEKLLVHERNLVRVESNLPVDQLALLGCAVLTGVGGVLNADLRPGSTAAVIGCGGVGLNVIQGLKLTPVSHIIAIDQVDAKLKLASRFGATHTVNTAETAGLDAVLDLVPGGLDYVFEVVGSPATAELAFACLAPAGQLFLIGIMADDSTITLPAAPFVQERSISGLLMGSGRFERDIPLLASLAEQGRIELAALVSQTITLDQINDASDELQSGGIARSVVRFGASRR